MSTVTTRMARTSTTRTGVLGRTDRVQPWLAASARTDWDAQMIFLHGDDDHIVPIGASAMLSNKLARNATSRSTRGLIMACARRHHDVINADLLAFAKA